MNEKKLNELDYVKNFVVYSIQKDEESDKVIYNCSVLEEERPYELEIRESGNKYPSKFLHSILLDNGYTIFSREHINYIYSQEEMDRLLYPLTFTAIVNNRFEKMKHNFIYTNDLMILANKEIRMKAEELMELRKLNE